MVGPHLGVLIVSLQPAALQELVQLRLGVLHAPVAVDAGVNVDILLLRDGKDGGRGYASSCAICT